jgi:hypothetical protein
MSPLANQISSWSLLCIWKRWSGTIGQDCIIIAEGSRNLPKGLAKVVGAIVVALYDLLSMF